MNRRILITEDANLDLREHFNYLAQNNRDRAFHFFDAARQTFASLARMPGMGQRYESEDEDIVDIRKWAVKGFKKYIIFYRLIVVTAPSRYICSSSCAISSANLTLHAEVNWYFEADEIVLGTLGSERRQGITPRFPA